MSATTIPPPSPVKLFTWWVLGFVIGFAFAELAVFLRTGNFIRLAGWRQPHYIHSLSDLVDNVRRAADYFLKHLRFLSTTTQLLCVAALLHAGWKWFKGDRHAPWAMILLLLVAASAYAQTIPAGIFISLRSVACFFLAIIALLFFTFHDYKPILIACAILVAFPLYMHNVNDSEFRGSIMRVWKTDLEKIPIVPQSVEGIVLLSSEDEVKQHVNALRRRFKLKPISTEPFNQPFRWCPVPYEAGFRHIYYDQKAIRRLSLEPDKVERFERCGIYEYAVQDNWLLVRFVQ